MRLFKSVSLFQILTTSTLLNKITFSHQCIGLGATSHIHIYAISVQKTWHLGIGYSTVVCNY